MHNYANGSITVEDVTTATGYTFSIPREERREILREERNEAVLVLPAVQPRPTGCADEVHDCMLFFVFFVF